MCATKVCDSKDNKLEHYKELVSGGHLCQTLCKLIKGMFFFQTWYIYDFVIKWELISKYEHFDTSKNFKWAMGKCY